jgi:tetratricopeptide (TPR) repeat protein
VETKSFVTLLGKMKSLKDTPLAKASVEEIEKQINLLIDDFLVEKTKEGITTHPVIRDYFRTGLKLTGSRREVADFLKARPGAEKPQNIEEVRDLVEAVQLLCDEGEFKAANDLIGSRLAEGGYGFDVFKTLPAVAEGLECDLFFVGDEARMQKVDKVLGKSTVAFHCSGVALYNRHLGNSSQALEWWYKCVDIYQAMEEKSFQAMILHDIAEIEMAMGNIKQARQTLTQALSLSHETKDLSNLRSEFACKGYYEFLLGNCSQAYLDFEIVLLYEQKRKSDEQYLCSIHGNQQAEFFIRFQEWKQFVAVNTSNIKSCEEEHWNNALAVCYLLQGWYEICQGQLSQAEKSLAQAERILRPSGMVEEICRLDWVWGLLAEAKVEYEKGLHRANDALFTCADKGFRLWQADLMVLRGRLHLLQFQKENDASNVIASPEKRGEAIPDSGAQANRLLRRPDESGTPRNDELKDLLEKAGDDGNEALKIAEQTGYIWAKVEALELLASYHKTRGALPGFNSQEEKDFARRYAKEAASIKAGLFLTEKQMEELKAQARKEFEKQVAGWEKK